MLLEDVLRQLAAEGAFVTRTMLVDYLGLPPTAQSREQVTAIALAQGWYKWVGAEERWLVPPGYFPVRVSP